MSVKKLLSIVLCLSIIFIATPRSFADEQAEIILRALIKAGVITQSDIDAASVEVKRESKSTEAALPSNIENRVTALESKAKHVPKWVKKMKLKGDFRLRHQYERMTSDGEGRNRGRIRLRLGVDTKINDKVKVGFGLSTGGTDPKSTNQTLQNTFESPDFRLDYGYAEYTPWEGFKMAGGKIKRKPYLWHATDLLWDSDIRPEGGSVHWEDSLFDLGGINYWLNGGVWILDETDQSPNNSDPFIKYVQLGVKSKNNILEKDVDTKMAVTHYSPHGVKGAVLDHNEGSNTNATTGLKSQYRSLALSAEVGVKDLLGGDLPFNIDERIAFFGDFIHNFDDELIGDEKTTGWAFGTKFGNKKLKEKGQWQVKYIKAILGKDAWLDVFPDGDRFSGGETDMKSHEVILNYVLKENIIFGIDYYKSRRYANSAPNSDNTEHIVQADLLLKF